MKININAIICSGTECCHKVAYLVQFPTGRVAMFCDQCAAVARERPCGTVVVPLSRGALKIMVERSTHDGRGWTDKHDAAHAHGELGRVACELVRVAQAPGRPVADPWGLAYRHRDDPEELLVIAGSLVAAEIDRRHNRGS